MHNLLLNGGPYNSIEHASIQPSRSHTSRKPTTTQQNARIRGRSDSPTRIHPTHHRELPYRGTTGYMLNPS